MSQAGRYSVDTGPFGPILQLTPDNGNPVVPAGGNVDVLGGNNTNGLSNIQTDGNPYNEPPVVPLNTLKIRLKDSIILPSTNVTGTEGVIALGSTDYITDRFLYGNAQNIFAGYQAGNLLTGLGTWNVGVGYQSMTAYQNINVGNVAVGYQTLDGPMNNTSWNVAVGFQALHNFDGGQFNTCVGTNVFSNTLGAGGSHNSILGYRAGGTGIGSSNSVVGSDSLTLCTGSQNSALGANISKLPFTGSYNVLLGEGTASAYAATGASSNIIIHNAGQVTDNNIIRIGTTGVGNRQQNECYIAAIANVSVSNQHFVLIDSVTEQLGSIDAGGFASTYNEDVGSAIPAAGILNIVGGTGITTSGAGNTVTISSTVAPVAWSVISASQTAVVNNGYFCNAAGTLALALPAASSVGDIIEVSNINTATGTQITQGAGQQIRFGASTTTLGAGGSLTSIALGDALKLVCSVANTTWVAVSAVGSWTVV